VLSKNISTGEYINDYLIIDTISSSLTSSLYRAEDTRQKSSTVTLKLLHSMHLSEQRRQQFFKEIQSLKKLRHEHILPILDVGIYENIPYLVTEYAPGGSLRDRVHLQSGHLLPVQETLTILTQVGQALQYAHQMNVIHGNLKPENILFNSENSALLTDFSLVTTIDAFSTDHSRHTNSFPYMAPEQFQGWMTEESDQYALGCIAYELFTGEVPFPGSDFSEIKHKHVTEKPISPTQRNLLLPISIEEAILKAMQKKSENRHPGVKDFVSSLTRPTSSHPGTQKPSATQATIATFDQAGSVTGAPNDAEPEIESTGGGTGRDNQNANASPSAPVWQYAPSHEDVHSPLESGLRRPSAFQQSTRVVAKQNKFPKEELSNLQTIAVSQPQIQNQNANKEQGVLFLGSSQRVAPDSRTRLAPRVLPPLNSPVGDAYRQAGNSVHKNSWLILLSIFMVIVVVISLALFHFALPALLSSKSNPRTISQNPSSTVTLAVAPTATPTATATPVLASNPAPTATPTLAPSPSPSPSPTPIPTLTVIPTSFQAQSDCQKTGKSYLCSSTLQLSQNHQGDLKWVASSGNLATNFDPPKGTLTPGGQQQVTIEVVTSCPHTGTINFTTKEITVTVSWTC
jgi:serine/threonine protein kinase